MLTLKLSLNRTLTQTLILTRKKANKKARINVFHFCIILFNLKIFGKIVTTGTYRKSGHFFHLSNPSSRKNIVT